MTDSENVNLLIPQSRSTAGLGVRDYIAIQREYINAIKTYLDMKYRVYCVTLPKMTIHPDGTIEHEYDFTDEQKETLRLVDEGIKQIQHSMGTDGLCVFDERRERCLTNNLMATRTASARQRFTGLRLH